ncbi:hypothetical protein C1922_08310 [Stenotrophomonas sp. ZAC14D2_NAIMI4_7]|nr:hypothetical protein C1922_08310 [Stenotrophomonas sp. ZAC14D2_NAIMI4_7]
MSTCLLAADLGNAADWAGVLMALLSTIAAWASVGVGVIAVVATTFVAVLAYRTSRQATSIAAEATRIAEQQHLEVVGVRDGNARIVARVLVHEVSGLPMELYILHQHCIEALARGTPKNDEDVAFFERTFQLGARSLLPGTEKSEDRLHYLPEKLGNDLAVLIGYSRTLSDTCQVLLSQVKVRTRPDHVPREIKVFAGSMDQIESLKKYVEKFSAYCMETAANIREFSGAQPHDFSKTDLRKEKSSAS